MDTTKGKMIIPVWISKDGVFLDLELGESVNVNTNFVASAYGRNTKKID